VVDTPVTRRSFLWLAASVAFVVLATANGAGYRYGVSDQAFYIPAVTHAAAPGAFPRDAALIDSQARLMILDELLASLMRTTGLSLDMLFLSAYLLSLALIWAGVLLIGSRVATGPTTVWTTAALGAAVTLRHRIPRTSANSLEPYFHPRLLAFGIGLLAIAALLRRRSWWAIALVGAAALVHVTTALWFAILIGIALAILDGRMRRVVTIGTIVVAIVAIWALTVGPLQSSTVRMDDVWLQAVASKDSLFPNEWPLWAWVGNLAVFAILLLAHRYRASRGVATPEDSALVWGATALVAIFLITLPAVAAHVAIAVQFQISRVFWLVDFLAVVYVIAAISASRTIKVRDATSEGAQSNAERTFMVREKRAVVLAVLLIAVSVSRGAYIIFIEHPERHLFELHLPDDPWEDAMQWLSRQPLDVGVLADPGHAWKYGTSVRVAAARDVFLEDVKDSAIAMYSRDVAVRVVERSRALGDFTVLTPERARALAAEYDLTYLVTEQPLPLPVAYRNSRFGIYRLR
jgi:hypothetical protein